MRNWFYIKDGEKIGPIEESELYEMLQVGVLDPDVKVWTKGLEEWASANQIDTFDFLEDLPPPPPKSVNPPPPPIRNAQPHEASESCVFYNTSTTRMIWMEILTFGLFTCYWTYRNWKYIKTRDGSNVSPFWRAFFCLFFVRSTMQEIHDDTDAQGVEFPQFSPNGLGITWVVCTILTFLLSLAAMGDPEFFSPVSFFFDLLGLACIGFIVPVQNYVNSMNSKIGSPPDENWTPGQIIMAVVGGLLWLSTLNDMMIL